MSHESAAEKAAAKASDDEQAAAEKVAAEKAAAKAAKAPPGEVGPTTAYRPESFKGNDQAPEADRDPVPTYRADMGEGLPPQTDGLNPDRAK